MKFAQEKGKRKLKSTEWNKERQKKTHLVELTWKGLNYKSKRLLDGRFSSFYFLFYYYCYYAMLFFYKFNNIITPAWFCKPYNNIFHFILCLYTYTLILMSAIFGSAKNKKKPTKKLHTYQLPYLCVSVRKYLFDLTSFEKPFQRRQKNKINKRRRSTSVNGLLLTCMVF